MFWADQLLKDRKGPELINDAWTPSGMVHMGSIKGPVMHDVLFQILKKQGKNVKFIYGFDDADPLDGLPPELEKTHSKYMGVPIHLVPSPDGTGSFAEFFGIKLKKILDELGMKPELYRTSTHYKDGTYDKSIKFVLDNAVGIRRVYEEIYDKKLSEDWLPLQVICSKCGKLGTTKVIGWDGKEVSFECREDLVKWAKGCGFLGKISPFGGNSKMPYKVEWAAKWWTYKVTIEGAGKDHASAGGTYDVAVKVLKDVFKKQPPFKFTYEFFLSEGRKMSSSKGVGLTGQELLEVLPPQLVRFLMIKTPPNQAVEFNPRSRDIIPRIYDDYQQAQTEEDINHRAFELSQIGKEERIPQIRFWTLAQWVQMPNMEEKIKKEGLEKWAKYARTWVDKYAPDEVKFEVQKEIPKKSKRLNEKQKEFLKKVSEELSKTWDAEEFQKKLYEWAKDLDLSSNEAFQALYIPIIGKDHGPKAAWIILENKDFVKKRFEEVLK